MPTIKLPDHQAVMPTIGRSGIYKNSFDCALAVREAEWQPGSTPTFAPPPPWWWCRDVDCVGALLDALSLAQSVASACWVGALNREVTRLPQENNSVLTRAKNVAATAASGSNPESSRLLPIQTPAPATAPVAPEGAVDDACVRRCFVTA